MVKVVSCNCNGMLDSTVSSVTLSNKGCSLNLFYLGGMYKQSLASPDSAFIVLQVTSTPTTPPPP